MSAAAMSEQSVYAASLIKRDRATKAETAQRWYALYDIVDAQRPMSVRQVFYRAVVGGLIDKTERGYANIQRALADMRRAREIPFAWITDGTRFQRRPKTHSNIEEALKETARFYRKSLWDQSETYVEVWCEKDALTGVIYPITSQFDVPLMVARGFASLSFLASAAADIEAEDRPAFIYHLGDYDPSGQYAAQKIEETLRELTPKAESTLSAWH